MALSSAPGAPRYVVLGAIHRGGMGEILLARMDAGGGFSRTVVLKRILPELSDDGISGRLFEREARLMARLDHPNIVRVFDAPDLDGERYLAMEYVRGRNFHQVIQQCARRQGAVPPRIAAHVVGEALRGLHHAHCATSDEGQPLDIVHRDISPGNLLLGFFGEVKVTDFGIAKMADTPSITGPRMIRGKARYTAPEVVRGAAASPSSDLYSAAVVLAEAVCGVPLWERNNVAETLLSIVTEPRDVTIDRIRDLAPLGAAPGLEAVLEQALAMRPSERHANAYDFAEALDRVCRASGGPVTQAELGAFLRDLCADAPDVPVEARPVWQPPSPPPIAVEVDAADAVVEAAPSGRPSAAPRATPPSPPPLALGDDEDTALEAEHGQAEDVVALVPSYDGRVEAQPPSYLSELSVELVGAGTDEVFAEPPPPPQLARAPRRWTRLESILWRIPPWGLVTIGLLLGLITALIGGAVALLTHP
jgi:serine/threonine protein kinase